jgi:thymidylate synthase (FAD)
MNVGDGKVVLISGGGKIYTDVAGRFVGSTRDLEDIVASDYNKNIVKNIIEAGHEAALEFDYFIFGVEGYSRVSETQLVRKRLASYMIKSGRIEKGGERDFSTVLPKDIRNFDVEVDIEGLTLRLDADDILKLIEKWYDRGVDLGYAEEDLRYMKPQATEFKGIIGLNAHGLRDWFRIRCCKNAQTEIRDMAMKMLKLSKEAAPDLFEDAGPNCVRMGYCPENKMQHESCNVVTKNDMGAFLNSNKCFADSEYNHLF